MEAWREELYLQHHGILGMKWGVRRYQNKDGSLTALGEKRLGKKIQKAEKKAIAKTYKTSRKNGGNFVFKSYRYSTGDNYDNAQENFEKNISQDSKYRDLSKKAFDAEKARLLAEKEAYGKKGYSDEAYEKFYSSEKGKKLEKESIKATEAKDRRAKELAKSYVDTIKEAKLKDLGITEHKDIAKKYISNKFNDFVWDSNLEYNPDNYYESWIEKEKFK